MFLTSDTLLSYYIHQCLVISYILVTARTYLQLCHGLVYEEIGVQFMTVADQLWGSN